MRKNLSKIALAGASLAFAFTISCGNHSLDDFLETKCGGKEYDANEFSCVGGELVGKCKGVDYYPDYQICNNGQIEDINNNTPSSSSSANEEIVNIFGYEQTYIIKNVTQSSFTQVQPFSAYYCLKSILEEEKVSYSKNDTTLSFWGLEFNGNSTSITGTWTREAYSAICEDDEQCNDHNKISKAVFTQNSVIYTNCLDTNEFGFLQISEKVKRKRIDCHTIEYSNGTEKVIVKSYPDHIESAYNGSICRSLDLNLDKACTEIIDLMKKDGIDENSEDYSIGLVFGLAFGYIMPGQLNYECLDANNFPEWFGSQRYNK